MQLLEYWSIIRRRLWLIGLLGLTVAAVSAFLAFRGPNAWCSKLQLLISFSPEVQATSPRFGVPDPVRYDSYYYYYAFVASEYLADDLSEVLKSDAFARDVVAELGHSIEPGLIVASTRTKKTHRTIDVSICGADRNAILEVGEAYERTLNTKMRDYFGQLQASNATARVINSASLSRGSSTMGILADVLLRTVLGLALGVALAFLLDFLDQTLRDRGDAERVLGLPILAEVPRARAPRREAAPRQRPAEVPRPGGARA